MTRGLTSVPVALAALLACLASAVAGPLDVSAGPAAHSTHLLTPRHAERFVALLAPIPLDEPFADGCRIPSLRLAGGEIRLVVAEPDGTTHGLILGPAEPDGPEERASAAFSARLADADAPDARFPPCTARVWAHIRARDDGAFWQPLPADAALIEARPPSPAHKPATAPTAAVSEAPAWGRTAALAFYRLLQALYLAALAYGVWLCVRRRGPMGTVSRGDALALLGALIVGTALRALWVEPVLIHENYCGVGRVACAAEPPCHSVTGNHSWGSFAFYNLALLASGNATTGVLVVNVLLAGLAQPLLVYALGRDLSGDDRVGVLAAWALALLPVHIRMSATESYFHLAMTLLLASTLAIRSFARTGGYARALLAAVAVALTVQTAKVYNLHALMAIAVLLLARPARKRIRLTHLLAGVAVFLGLTAPHWLELLASPALGATSYLPTGPLGLLVDVVSNDIYLQPEYTPPVLAVAWVAGAFLLTARRPREGATVLVLLLGLGLVFFGADPNDVNYPTRLRMQLSLAPLVAVFAGVGLRYAVQRGRGPGLVQRHGPTIALVALVAASAPFLPRYHALVKEVLVPAREARFLFDTIPRLPPLDALVTVDRAEQVVVSGIEDDIVETHFPWNELTRHLGPDVERLTLGNVLAAPQLVRGRRVAFYQAANAHVRLPEERLTGAAAAAGPRPSVVALRIRFALTPIPGATGALPVRNPATVRNVYAADPVPVGFYWLEERAEPGVPPRPRSAADPPEPREATLE